MPETPPPSSTSVGVTCSHCRQLIGDAYHPGDASLLFAAHQPVCPVLHEAPC